MSVPSANVWEGTCVIALSLGHLLLGYRTRFRLAGSCITGRNWCPQPGRSGGGGKAGSWAGLAAAGDPAPPAPWGRGDGCAVPRLGIALGTWSGCLGRAQPPRCPPGSLPGTHSSPPVPQPSPRLLRCPQQEHQRGQGPHMKEKCLHPPHARNICPQGVRAHGHGSFYICCFSGTAPKYASSPA